MLQLLFFLFFAFSSCTNPPYTGEDVFGADEFVMDSYKIREGKFAILEMKGVEPLELDPDFLEEYPDQISEGDLLNIVFYHPTRSDLSSSIQHISSQGGFCVVKDEIVLPFLEPIQIGGLSLEEARVKIEAAYRKELRDVTIFLSYKDRVRKKVELAGLVDRSCLPVDGKLRLFETLATAKVPPQANLFKSYMVREGSLVSVDFFKLLKEGDMSQNIVMRGGDKIYIAEASASTLMVLGEVNQEKIVDLPNGFMTLRQAIAEARGISQSGDKSYIQIIRGSILSPKIYTINWQHVIGLPSESLLLIPGDIVYVAATPIAEWNRFVSQILPTFIGIDLVSKGIKGLGINVNP